MYIYQEGRGVLNDYYTSPQSFIVMLSYLLAQQLLGLLLNWLVHLTECTNVLTTNCNLQNG